MSTAPTLTIQLVLFHEDVDRLARTVESIARSAAVARDDDGIRDPEILLGDCSEPPCLSGDDVRRLEELAAADGVGLRHRAFEENLGSAGGSNALARLSASDLLFVLNPDTQLHPDTINRLVGALAPDVAIAEGRQLPLEHPKSHDPETGETSWASGACMLLRRRAFDEVGGFDTDHFFLQCDDVDLSWRLRAAGWRIVHVPRALVLHDKRISAGGTVVMPDVERYHSTLGRLLLYTRYGQPDLLQETIDRVTAGNSQPRQDAVAEFERRSREGLLPDPLPEETATQVAQFHDGNFARHRW